MTRHLPLLMLLVVLAACGDDAPADTTTTTTTTRAVTTTTAATTTEAPTTTSPETTTTTSASTTTTTEPEAEVFAFDIADGQVDGPDRVEVARGTTVVLVVTADVTDEVHLHGYDVFADVDDQSAAVIEFVATIPGIFELELEDAALLITEIQVS